MENTPPNTITKRNLEDIADIRQSQEWQSYLAYLGWHTCTTDSHKPIYYRGAGPMVVAKMQRPQVLTEQELTNIDDLAQRHKFSYLKLEPTFRQDLVILEQAGFSASLSPLSPPSTIFIDLTLDSNNLWTKLSPSAKYSINRAKREGGIVEHTVNPKPAQIDEVYPIVRTTALKQKFLVPDIEDLKTKLQLWREKFILSVSRNGKGQVFGVKIFLAHNKSAWFMHGGTSDEGRKTKYGYLLLWNAILKLKALGYELLDLEGKDDSRFPTFTRNWGGFSHFKEKFGGIAIDYPRPYNKYYNKLLQAMNTFYRHKLPL